MIENDTDVIKYKNKQNEQIKEYNTYKNTETIEAQKIQGEYMKKLIEDFSGVVCDLSTGMGNMLQKF